MFFIFNPRGKGCSTHIRHEDLSKGPNLDEGCQGVLPLVGFVTFRILKPCAFLDFLGRQGKGIAQGYKGYKWREIKESIQVLLWVLRVWRGNLHLPARKRKTLILNYGLSMTCNYLCPEVPLPFMGNTIVKISSQINHNLKRNHSSSSAFSTVLSQQLLLLFSC